MANRKQAQLIHPKAEQTLRQIILKDLENKGRKDYDKPHTEAVVFWMKDLLERLKDAQFDSQVLITAAYAHDWGYAGLFDDSDSRSFSTIISRKALHMKRGAEMIEQLLYSRLFRYFSDAQMQRVIHLVSVHDKVRELNSEDELLLMEADTLGMLDREQVPSTLSKKDQEIFLEKSFYNLRLPRFRHPVAKDIAIQLLNP